MEDSGVQLHAYSLVLEPVVITPSPEAGWAVLGSTLHGHPVRCL